MAFCSVRASQAATSRCRRCFEIFVHLTEKEDEKTDFFLCEHFARLGRSVFAIKTLGREKLAGMLLTVLANMCRSTY
jgi:hypothetical protein